MDVPHPDEKSLITYVSSLYDVMPRVPDIQDGVKANVSPPLPHHQFPLDHYKETRIWVVTYARYILTNSSVLNGKNNIIKAMRSKEYEISYLS